MTEKFKPSEVPISQLKLGDVVDCFGPDRGPFSTGVVVKTAPDYVTIHRPYGITSDFSMGDPPMVIYYTGLETFSILFTAPPIWVHNRKDIK